MSLVCHQRIRQILFELELFTNKHFTVLRNPLYFVFLILLGIAGYVTYTLNLWGPIIRMTNAASSQGLEVFKERLREFLETSDTGRQAMAMSGSKPSERQQTSYQ